MPTMVYGETNSASSGGGGGGGTSGVAIGPFAVANTGNASPGLGGFSGFAYGTVGAGSVIAASVSLASGQSGTTSIAVYKNGTLLVQAFTNITFSSINKYYTVSFTPGTYTFVANDFITLVVTASSTAYTLAGHIITNAY